MKRYGALCRPVKSYAAPQASPDEQGKERAPLEEPRNASFDSAPSLLKNERVDNMSLAPALLGEGLCLADDFAQVEKTDFVAGRELRVEEWNVSDVIG